MTHAKFGLGTIAAVEAAAGDQRKLTIDFGGTRRVLLAKFVAPGVRRQCCDPRIA
ncbi:hypothetical protein [Nannocystis pusilla]|uniref:hypothetical protein n=1 Tax=Nannocystis pusilla TaxID=889268 RepID=UPI003DA57F3A